MSITLAVGVVVVPLPVDMYWSDEFTWSPVQQSVEPSTTGVPIIDVAEWQGGRPITLGRDPGGRDTGWMARAILEQLKAWAAEPGQELVLTMRGIEHTVLWAHHAGPAIEAEPVQHYTDIDDSDYYRVQLRFMEI